MSGGSSSQVEGGQSSYYGGGSNSYYGVNQRGGDSSYRDSSSRVEGGSI